MRCIIIFLVSSIIIFIIILILIRLGGVGIEEFNPKKHTLIQGEDIVEDRFIKLEGAFNIRDLGGIQSRCGRKVAKGRVYRGDRLTYISDDDLRQIEKLGIKTSIDLREKTSFDNKPNRLPKGTRYVNIPIFEKVSNKVVWAMLFSRNSLDKIFSDDYIYQIEYCSKSFGRALEMIADERNLPLMYNCTSGKDRTGILTALILMIIGIDEDAIVRDYSLSNYNYEKAFSSFEESYAKRIKRLCSSPRELGVVVGVNPKWIIRAIDYIKDNYGTIDYYLLTKAKLSSESIDKIRYNLLVSDESFCNL